MNKPIKQIAFAIMLVLTSVVTFTGCAGLDQNLLGNLKPSVSVQNPRKLGKLAGEGAYLAYVVCKNNPKYDKEVAMCEEVWDKLLAEDGTVTVADINNLAIQMGSAAVADKYGWVYASAVVMGMQAAGALADNAASGNIDTEFLNEFLGGAVEGVNLMKATIPADALIPAEKEKKVKVFECPGGNCTITPSSRDVKYQQRLAQQLIDDGYVDKDEVVKEGHNAWQNCKDLITRCKTLRKYKVEETRCYIHHFIIENGKVKEIEFHMIGYQNGDEPYEYVTNCVTCEMYLELEDLPDEIIF